MNGKFKRKRNIRNDAASDHCDSADKHSSLSSSDPKRKSRTFWAVIMVAIMLITVIVLVLCINWIMTSAELKGRESLRIFAEQTGHRLEDMLETNSNVMLQLKNHFDAQDELTMENIMPVLQSYRDNWSASDVGVLFEDKTAIGADGNVVVFDSWIDPHSVEGHAYGVRIVGNKVGNDTVIAFAVYDDDLIVDNKSCVGFFMNFPLSTINTMMLNTEYGNDAGTFISIINQEGDTIWLSNADSITSEGLNIYEDLKDAQFEDVGEIEAIRTQLRLGYSGTTVYNYFGERRALAYIPLKTNYWKLIIGSAYDAIIEQSGNNLVALVLIASLVVMVSLCVTLYFIYRQRNSELSKQRAEMQAARAIDETKAKSDFLSRMSHELRTPLNGLVGMIELVSRHGDNKHKREEYLKKIKKSSEYLVSLINDILDVAKIEHNKIELVYEPFNMKEMCQTLSDIFYPLTAEKNIGFVMDYEGLTHDCYIGDEIRVKQIVVNLLSNAVKFTDTGKIKCTLAEILFKDKTALEIKVEDTGKGISKEFIDRVFYPFEQEHTPSTHGKTGTGLGLAICLNLVKLSGGTITVDSKVNEGSIFTVKIPLEPTDSDIRGNKIELARDLRLDGINILLAEDNDLNAEITETLLSDVGAKVTIVKNGVKAYKRFEASEPGEFDIILMDIQMPEMDGIEATKRIRTSKHPDAASVPIIAMTANALNEDREIALSAGMNDHLSKPVYSEVLYKVVLTHYKKDSQ